jgi:molecular chaperone GrpE
MVKKEKLGQDSPEAQANPAPGAASGVEPTAASNGALESAPKGAQSAAEIPGVVAEMADLMEKLDKARAEAAEYKDGWQRAVADFQNYRRRVDAESRDTYQNAVGNIVRRYLPILDDLERALAHCPPDLPWAQGIELIYRKLKTILENEGVKRIEAEGQMFDPNFHEAILQEPAEGVESGRILSVVQNGYMIGERVIRPAQVRVAQ